MMAHMPPREGRCLCGRGGVPGRRARCRSRDPRANHRAPCGPRWSRSSHRDRQRRDHGAPRCHRGGRLVERPRARPRPAHPRHPPDVVHDATDRSDRRRPRPCPRLVRLRQALLRLPGPWAGAQDRGRHAGSRGRPRRDRSPAGRRVGVGPAACLSAGAVPNVGPDVRGGGDLSLRIDADGDFVLGIVPGSGGRASVAVGLNHAFKFAPVIGRILADLATTGSTPHPIDRFCIDRFAPAAAAT